MSAFLDAMGATPQVRAHFMSYEISDGTLARVSRVHRGAYKVFTDEGKELPAQPTGILLYQAASSADLPAVGDWVVVHHYGHEAIVHAVLPRHTAFLRRSPGTRDEAQVVAANVDTVFLVCGLDQDFNLRRLERYLVLVQESGAAAVIVLNKADLCGNVAERQQQTAKVAGNTPVVTIQANTPAGVIALAPYLRGGRTVALLGSSGAGKSTLTNQLLGAPHQETSAVRTHDSRGRHTTTHRQLFPLPGGGALIDTPGLRELQLWAGPESLHDAFSEVTAAAQECRFSDCAHTDEPGCAVQAALAAGTLDLARWESYRKLQREIRHHQLATDHTAARQQKQQWKAIHKAMRHHHKRQ